MIDGGGSLLGRFVRRAAEASDASRERCDLCDDVVPASHRHLVEPATRSVQCVCLPCSVLFDSPTTATGRYRIIPQRRLRLRGDVVDDGAWAALEIPVGIAFLSWSTAAGRIVAAYPSPAGAVESGVPIDTWPDLVAREPVLDSLAPDVEALLVNRARGNRFAYLVPIDDCFRLVALVRLGWKGLGGGTAVWRQIGEFFEQVDRHSRPAPDAVGATRTIARAEPTANRQEVAT